MKRRYLPLSALLISAVSTTVAAEEPPREAAAIDHEIEAQNAAALERDLVTRTASGDGGLAHLGWAVLTIPERLLEATFLPIGAAVVVVERYRLASRVSDALRNDAGTIAASPKLKISTGQGLGVGASLVLKSRLASEARARASGVIELDGDFRTSLALERRVAKVEGRRLALDIDFDRQGGSDFFGEGGQTEADDKRELGVDDLRAGLSLDLNGRAADRFYGTARLGYLRQTLYAGDGTSPPVGETGDTVAPPNGFGLSRNFAVLGFDARVDSRDTQGRTSSGFLLEFSGRFTLDVEDSRSNGVTAVAQGGLFIPVAGRNRTLVVSLGVGAAESATAETPLIPFDALLVLGRGEHLSGYAKDRFRARRAVWGRAEYRYPIWYMSEFPVVLTTRLFVDLAREGNQVADLIERPIRYSGGTGFILELYEDTLTGAQIAMSPEGVEFVLTAGSFL